MFARMMNMRVMGSASNNPTNNKHLKGIAIIIPCKKMNK